MTGAHSHRFDRSFVIRMIRDFFIALVAVVILEMIIRFGIVYFNYETSDRVATSVTADRLASDLKDVMLNAGGPVAARTIYPTWKRTYHDLGFEIAILPSHKTSTSIVKSYGFEPHGIPQEFAAGRFHEAEAALVAEAFCVGCHVDASPGDVLGRVVVRNYFSSRLSHWWQELRLALMVGMGNILLHTLVLFFLLRARMESLLALRSQLMKLARGRLDLSFRAEIRSDDEFGALAGDLNTFLDRLCDVLADIDEVLKRVMAAKHRLDHAFDQMKEHYDEIHTISQNATKNAVVSRGQQEILSRMLNESMELSDIVVGLLQVDRANTVLTAPVRDRLREALVAQKQRAEAYAVNEAEDHLVDLTRHVYESSHFIESMAGIRERMELIAESGHTLLERLSGETDPAPDSHAAHDSEAAPDSNAAHDSDAK